jgi:hypothetical protein
MFLQIFINICHIMSIKEKFVHNYANHTTCFTLKMCEFFLFNNYTFRCIEWFQLRYKRWLFVNTCVKFSDKHMIYVKNEKLKQFCQIECLLILNLV